MQSVLVKPQTNISFGARQMISVSELRGLLEKGYSIDNISKYTGNTSMYIRHLIDRNNLTPDGLARLQNLEKQILELKNQRATLKQIKEATGESDNVVRSIIANLFPEGYIRAKQATRTSPQSIAYMNRKLQIDTFEGKTPMYKRKPDVETRKLSAKMKMCKEILDLRAQGFSVKEIAETLRKSEATVKGYLMFSKQKKLNWEV